MAPFPLILSTDTHCICDTKLLSQSNERERNLRVDPASFRIAVIQLYIGVLLLTAFLFLSCNFCGITLFTSTCNSFSVKSPCTTTIAASSAAKCHEKRPSLIPRSSFANQCTRAEPTSNKHPSSFLESSSRTSRNFKFSFESFYQSFLIGGTPSMWPGLLLIARLQHEIILASIAGLIIAAFSAGPHQHRLSSKLLASGRLDIVPYIFLCHCLLDVFCGQPSFAFASSATPSEDEQIHSITGDYSILKKLPYNVINKFPGSLDTNIVASSDNLTPNILLDSAPAGSISAANSVVWNFASSANTYYPSRAVKEAPATVSAITQSPLRNFPLPVAGGAAATPATAAVLTPFLPEAQKPLSVSEPAQEPPPLGDVLNGATERKVFWKYSAWERVQAKPQNVVVLTDIDDTLWSSGGWRLAGQTLGGVDRDYERGVPYPGISALYFVLAAGPHATATAAPPTEPVNYFLRSCPVPHINTFMQTCPIISNSAAVQHSNIPHLAKQSSLSYGSVTAALNGQRRQDQQASESFCAAIVFTTGGTLVPPDPSKCLDAARAAAEGKIIPARVGILSARVTSSFMRSFTRSSIFYQDVNRILEHGARLIYGPYIIPGSYCHGFENTVELVRDALGGQDSRGRAKVHGFRTLLSSPRCKFQATAANPHSNMATTDSTLSSKASDAPWKFAQPAAAASENKVKLVFFGDTGEKDLEVGASVGALESETAAVFVHVIFEVPAQDLCRNRQIPTTVVPSQATPFTFLFNSKRLRAWQLTFDAVVQTSLQERALPTRFDQLTDSQLYAVGRIAAIPLRALMTNSVIVYFNNLKHTQERARAVLQQLRARLQKSSASGNTGADYFSSSERDSLDSSGNSSVNTDPLLLPLIFIKFDQLRIQRSANMPVSEDSRAGWGGIISRIQDHVKRTVFKVGASSYEDTVGAAALVPKLPIKKHGTAEDWDHGVPIIPYRTAISAATSAFLLRMINLQDLVNLVIATVRDYRSLGLLEHCGNLTEIEQLLFDISNIFLLQEDLLSGQTVQRYDVLVDALLFLFEVRKSLEYCHNWKIFSEGSPEKLLFSTKAAAGDGEGRSPTTEISGFSGMMRGLSNSPRFVSCLAAFSPAVLFGSNTVAATFAALFAALQEQPQRFSSNVSAAEAIRQSFQKFRNPNSHIQSMRKAAPGVSHLATASCTYLQHLQHWRSIGGDELEFIAADFSSALSQACLLARGSVLQAESCMRPVLKSFSKNTVRPQGGLHSRRLDAAAERGTVADTASAANDNSKQQGAFNASTPPRGGRAALSIPDFESEDANYDFHDDEDGSSYLGDFVSVKGNGAAASSAAARIAHESRQPEDSTVIPERLLISSKLPHANMLVADLKTLRDSFLHHKEATVAEPGLVFQDIVNTADPTLLHTSFTPAASLSLKAAPTALGAATAANITTTTQRDRMSKETSINSSLQSSEQLLKKPQQSFTGAATTPQKLPANNEQDKSLRCEKKSGTTHISASHIDSSANTLITYEWYGNEEQPVKKHSAGRETTSGQKKTIPRLNAATINHADATLALPPADGLHSSSRELDRAAWSGISDVLTTSDSSSSSDYRFGGSTSTDTLRSSTTSFGSAKSSGSSMVAVGAKGTGCPHAYLHPLLRQIRPICARQRELLGEKAPCAIMSRLLYNDKLIQIFDMVMLWANSEYSLPLYLSRLDLTLDSYKSSASRRTRHKSTLDSYGRSKEGKGQMEFDLQAVHASRRNQGRIYPFLQEQACDPFAGQ